MILSSDILEICLQLKIIAKIEFYCFISGPVRNIGV